MGAGESGEDEVSRVGVALGYLHAGDTLVDLTDVFELGEVEPGINALGVEIKGNGDDIKIAGAFAVSEECTLNAIRSGK